MNFMSLKKFLVPLLALCSLSSQAMHQDSWNFFGATASGYQLPANSPTKTPIKVNTHWHALCNNLTKDDLVYELEQFFKVENSGLLANPASWLNNQMPSQKFFSSQEKFEPYVMKLQVTPETEIAFHGDIHGDKNSLIAYLNWLAENGYTDSQDPFTIKKENFYMIFLGDYTDRGQYGAEVIFTIARLKRTNPDKVFLVRGNHEDIDINAGYGFKKELAQKFKDDGSILATINRMYGYLPAAIYLVCDNGTGIKDAILCCHGGIEVGFNVDACRNLLNGSPKIQCTLLGDLLRKTNCNALSPRLAHIKNFSDVKDFTPVSPADLHFLWNDFEVDNLPTAIKFGRAWECDKSFTDFVNAIQSSMQCVVRGVFRGHQHGDNKMMRRILNKDKKNDDADIGVGKLWIEGIQKPAPQALWDGIVCTFSVCPHTSYGPANGYNFDSFGILKTANQYTDWKLKMHRITPIVN